MSSNNDSRTKTPLAVFTYNRPRYAEQLLGTVARCARLDECQLYIYCDAAKNPGQVAAVEESRRVVRAWAEKLNAVVVERVENFGLARSIVTAVTQLCEEFGRVIVLEDDLQVSPDFLDFMLRALARYRDEAGVYQISGFTFRIKYSPPPDAFFIPLTASWGWATWARAWRDFDWNAAGAVEALADAETRRRFNADESGDYYTMLQKCLAGQNDSWAVRWWWAVFKAGGLVLYPRKSLVWAGGFDESSTHNRAASAVSQDALESFSQQRLPRSQALPDKIAVDERAFDKIKAFLKKQRRREEQRTLATLARRALKKVFRSIAPTRT